MKYYTLILGLFFASSVLAQNQQIVDNIRVEPDAAQRRVKITYDIAGRQTIPYLTIRIYRSNGTQIERPTLIGFESVDVKPGLDKVAYWDVAKDSVFANEPFKFEILAEKDQRQPFPPVAHLTSKILLGAGTTVAVTSWLNFRIQRDRLIKLGSEVDPDQDGNILNPTLNAQWRAQYKKTQNAKRPTLTYIGAGVAVVAALVETYGLFHDRGVSNGISLSPSKYSLGLSINYRF